MHPSSRLHYRRRGPAGPVIGRAGWALLLTLTLFGGLVALASSPGAAGGGAQGGAVGAPVAVQQAELHADDGAVTDHLGYAVDLSGDAALCGAPRRDSGGKADAGAAYVFVRSGGSWEQQAVLVAPDGAAGDQFGTSVAVAGDTAVVGAPYHDVSGKGDAGAAYVFVRSGAAWSWQATLTGDAASDQLGYAVDVAPSGGTALVGAPYHDSAGGSDAGAAYVYTQSGTTWTRQASLTASDVAAGDDYGWAVALTDGTALVGAPSHDAAAKPGAGAAYAYTGAGSSWTLQGALVAGDAASYNSFGYAVSLSGDSALVGAAYRSNPNAYQSGAAYVFTRGAGVWTQQGELAAAEPGKGDLFGYSVALSGDAAVIGAPDMYSGLPYVAGAAYVFARSGASWSQKALLTADGPNTADYFGNAVSLDGATALVGAPYRDYGDYDVGAAAVFLLDLTPAPAPHIATLTPRAGRRGAVVTVVGSGFGARRGTGFVKFGAAKPAGYLSWSATRIRCKVPAKAPFGTLKVRVTTGAGTSNALSFKVKR